MYKLCRTEQSAARQRELEKALLEAMNAARYEDITVSDFCQRAGIPRKSFYRYFSSKDGALHALIDHTLMEYEGFGSLRPDGPRTVASDLKRFFAFWMQHKNLLDALQRSGLSGVLIERSISYALSETVTPSRFMKDASLNMRRYVVMFSVCGLMTMMIQWHHDGFDVDISEMATIAARLLNQPLFPKADQLL